MIAGQVVQDILNDSDGDHADDATWVLTSSFVILTMQSGFGMLEMGCSARGHEVNIMLKNVYDVVCGALAYYVLGFGISYGSPSNGFMGMGDFFVDTDGRDPTAAGLLFTSYIFQFSFAATATTIVSGCLAMRCKFLVYCIYSFYSVICYAFVAHWVWSDTGWLGGLGAHDFAGSGPVPEALLECTFFRCFMFVHAPSGSFGKIMALTCIIMNCVFKLWGKRIKITNPSHIVTIDP